VDVTVSDMHALIDLETGQRVNPARDVTVGARVWLGIGTFVGKGASIGEGAVVGARTFVSGEVRPNTVVAGNPPRLLRENVSWRFSL
jgi:acetyltransferase-like isoleucine patch superfamily enzyme